MNLNLSLIGRVRRSLAVACVFLSAASSYGGQTIPGVDIIVKKTPGGKVNNHVQPNIPAGDVFQLNDMEWPLPAGINRVKTSDKARASIVAPPDLPDDLGGGNWELNTSFDVTYSVELETPDGIVALLATGTAHVSGTGITLTDWDNDGDSDLDDFIQFQLHGPIHQFDVEVNSFEVVDSIAGIRLRESPTLASTAQIVRRDIPGGEYRIASFFDVFTEMSIDGGATWTPANSSLQFISVVPEPTGLALVGIAMFAGGISRRRRGGNSR